MIHVIPIDSMSSFVVTRATVLPQTMEISYDV